MDSRDDVIQNIFLLSLVVFASEFLPTSRRCDCIATFQPNINWIRCDIDVCVSHSIIVIICRSLHSRCASLFLLNFHHHCCPSTARDAHATYEFFSSHARIVSVLRQPCSLHMRPHPIVRVCVCVCERRQSEQIMYLLFYRFHRRCLIRVTHSTIFWIRFRRSWLVPVNRFQLVVITRPTQNVVRDDFCRLLCSFPSLFSQFQFWFASISFWSRHSFVVGRQCVLNSFSSLDSWRMCLCAPHFKSKRE